MVQKERLTMLNPLSKNASASLALSIPLIARGLDLKDSQLLLFNAKRLHQKQEATRQAQVEEEWAEAEKRAQNLEERIKWAITKPPNIEKQPGLTIGTQKKNAAKAEKQWGNSMIGQPDNGNWSTLVGERLVYDILELRGESPRKVERKGGFEPDWETDNFIYEVKTSNWWVDGSAGEKVLGTWIKYQSIPELYGKPLRIICVANQEHELQYGKIKYFGPDVSTKTKQALELARSWGIEYITFSDLAKQKIQKKT